MNLTPLRVHDRHRAPTPVLEAPTTTHAIQEFFLLEECVTRCETLAETISSDGQHQTLMRDLSECIAACQTYLAAKARESRFESPLRQYCLEALVAAADSCNTLPAGTTRSWRKIVRAALRHLGAADAPDARLWN